MYKKIVLILLTAILLSGCNNNDTIKTVAEALDFEETDDAGGLKWEIETNEEMGRSDNTVYINGNKYTYSICIGKGIKFYIVRNDGKKADFTESDIIVNSDDPEITINKFIIRDCTDNDVPNAKVILCDIDVSNADMIHSNDFSIISTHEEDNNLSE